MNEGLEWIKGATEEGVTAKGVTEDAESKDEGRNSLYIYICMLKLQQ